MKLGSVIELQGRTGDHGMLNGQKCPGRQFLVIEVGVGVSMRIWSGILSATLNCVLTRIKSWILSPRLFSTCRILLLRHTL